MAAFDRFKKMGEEKFRLILNSLMQGKSAMALARQIQQEWHEFSDVGEKTLTQQLNRLRLAAAEGMFGKEMAERMIAKFDRHNKPVPVHRVTSANLNVYEKMVELAQLQEERVKDLATKEKNMPLPVGAMLQAANAVFSDYAKLLQDIQKMRFDLGFDEFKGVVSGMRAVATAVTLPDGTKIQQQVFEAASTLDEVFSKRNIQLPEST